MSEFLKNHPKLTPVFKAAAMGGVLVGMGATLVGTLVAISILKEAAMTLSPAFGVFGSAMACVAAICSISSGGVFAMAKIYNGEPLFKSSNRPNRQQF